MTDVSIFPILEGHAASDPGREAVAGEFGRLTYTQASETAAALAGQLVRLGLVPGEPTAICLKDEIEHLLCATTLLCLATPQVNLPSFEADGTRRAIAQKIGATQIIAAHPEPWMHDMRVIVPTFGTGRPGDAEAGLRSFRDAAPETAAIYQTTSGSTSAPRSFALSFERILLIAAARAADPQERRVLRTTTMENGASRVHRLAALIAGLTCVFGDASELSRLTALCAREDVTDVHIGTYKLAALLATAARSGDRLPSFTRLMSGGSRVSGSMRRAVRDAITDNLHVSYATSEIGQISTATPDQHDAFPEGLGFPFSTVTVEIVDAEDRPVARGEVGHARLRKVGTPKTYVGESGGSAAFRDGWFRPGDMLSWGEGEPLVFHGRADEMMILNGINIFPAAIEDALESHPDVVEAVAFPVISRLHGEIPVAAVVLSPDAARRAPEAYLEFSRQQLGIRAPRQVRIVERIPRNAAGKPLRRALAES